MELSSRSEHNFHFHYLIIIEHKLLQKGQGVSQVGWPYHTNRQQDQQGQRATE